MEQALIKQGDAKLSQLSPDVISNIVLKGDLSGLNPSQKVAYYNSVCERVGVDPATQPFQLLNLSGKQVLYCSKAGAEQLTKLHKISHEVKDRQTVNDVFVVYVRAIEPGGRFEDSSGAVSIGGIKGDNLANALMKAETKAKRRSTLSLLGLGMLDETEIETIPGAQRVAVGESLPVSPVEIPVQGGQTATVEGVTFTEFDPRKEEITFGKHRGLLWIEIPNDYVQWLEENGQPDAKAKAKATLDFKEAVESQSKEHDPLAAAFDKPEAEQPPIQELPPADALIFELEEVARTFNIVEIETWWKKNEGRINSLDKKHVGPLRKTWIEAKKQARQSGGK